MKLLIVEDEKKIADNLKKGLENEGFAVDVAYDGRTGLSSIHINQYDLILLDLMLPGMTGMEILSTIRNEKNKVPVIILTAKDQLDDVVAGLNTGSDDYITKPFSFDELLARINAVIRRNTSTTPQIKIKDLVIDTIQKSVHRNGVALDLTKTEYGILILLASTPNRYYTESEILESVWDSAYEGMSNVVRVHLKNLRSKLDKNFPNLKPLLATERGMGYKISND